jgi:hypothetical protein
MVSSLMAQDYHQGRDIMIHTYYGLGVQRPLYGWG